MLVFGCGGGDSADQTIPSGPPVFVNVRIQGDRASLLATTERCGAPLATHGSCEVFESCIGSVTSCTLANVHVEVVGERGSVALVQAKETSLASLVGPFTVKSDAPAFEVTGVAAPMSPFVLAPQSGATIPVSSDLEVTWEPALLRPTRCSR